MSTLFISDLHLCPQALTIIDGFLHFLQKDAMHADALYILGDLFEIWTGDDDPEPLYNEIATALKGLKQAGVPCYFIHGNRDFLLGESFAFASGMQFLQEETVLKIYNHHILILHGDKLCTYDRTYQKFRSIVRNPMIQKLFLTLPLYLRLKISNKIRTNSKQANQCKPEIIMDVTPKEVIQTMINHGVLWMIHGHTHRPAIHQLNFKNKRAYRIVLGSWRFEGSIIKINANTIEHITYQF